MLAGRGRLDLAEPPREGTGERQLVGDPLILWVAATEAGELATRVPDVPFGERTARVLELEVPIAEKIELRPTRRRISIGKRGSWVSITEQIELDPEHAPSVRRRYDTQAAGFGR